MITMGSMLSFKCFHDMDGDAQPPNPAGHRPRHFATGEFPVGLIDLLAFLFFRTIYPSLFYYLFGPNMEETRDATIHDGASTPRPMTANRNKSPPSQEFVFKHALCIG